MRRPLQIHIDFGPSWRGWLWGHASTSYGPSGSMALLLATMVMLGWLVWRQLSWQSEMQDLEDTLVAARGQLQAHEHKAQKNRSGSFEPTTLQRKRLDELVHQLNTPWPSIFDLVERTKNADVALIGLEPNAKSRRIRLTLEGKGLEELYAYTARLSSSPEVEQVQLLRHERQDEAPQQPLRLTLDLQWRSALQVQPVVSHE